MTETVALSPATQARLKSARSLAIAAPLLWGGIFGSVASGLQSALGDAIFVASAVLLVAVVVLWPRVRARSRWLLSFGVAAIAYIVLTLLLGGLAAVAGCTSVTLATAVGAAAVCSGAWKLRRDLASYDAVWERHRAANEREVLDIGAGTYDAGRGFAPLALAPTDAVVTGARSAADVAARFTPVIAGVAALGAVLSTRGGLDVRVVGVAVLGPLAAVAFTPVLAQALVHLRRLRAYEQQLGRPIYNR